MKSNICFLLISVLLFVNSAQAYACGPYEYYPYGYKMYRVFDKNSVIKTDERKENCILWQKLTSAEIPLEDIEMVVYKYTLTQMRELMTVHDPNAFATWIRTNEDEEIYDFLMLAKICENTRGLMNDPWYYPSKNDGTYMSLIEIEEKAKAYKGTRLKDRYALQAVRAMFSAQRYQECVDYWNDVEEDLPDGLIKEMSRSYLVGAYSRIGQIDVALEYFTDVEDLNSIIFCLRRQGKIKDVADELECIAKYAPESYQIPEILQWVVTGFEPWGSADYTYQERMDTTMVNSIDRELFGKLYRLSVRMTQQPVSKNRAVWCYTAAFLADMDAKPHEAWRYIQMATKCSTSEYMKESIRVLKIYLDAKVSVYDSAYESRLFNDLRWLDAKIRGELTEDLRSNITEYYYYYLRSNISFYYWNDMLRRILLAEVCPRMLDRGMQVRALQLANLADNMLLNLNNNIEGKTLKEYRSSDNYNSIDYCSEFFMMMKDCVTIGDLTAYVNNTQSAQSSAFDNYLNERGFIDKDYFYDLIGTRYLSELNYDKAVRYLSNVSSSYQPRLNTSAYMYRDPFSIAESSLREHKNYKLTFAKEMLRLEKSIASATDQNKKAFDLIRYGTGLRNSFTYCWILTEYRKFGWSYDLSPYANGVLKKVESIYNEALNIVDNDELAAIAYVQLCKWKTAVDKYPNTYAARYTKMMCDNLCDYSTNWVVRTTYDFQE